MKGEMKKEEEERGTRGECLEYFCRYLRSFPHQIPLNVTTPQAESQCHLFSSLTYQVNKTMHHAIP